MDPPTAPDANDFAIALTPANSSVFLVNTIITPATVGN